MKLDHKGFLANFFCRRGQVVRKVLVQVFFDVGGIAVEVIVEVLHHAGSDLNHHLAFTVASVTFKD